jgi:[methyl-Co(III) methanol-specific corrinoid protein]:coenzyme M methyltransferase
MSRRQEILDLLSGKKADSQPAFSGLIHVTTEGLARQGLSLHEIHREAEKMARAAASTFKSTGVPSATLPLDLCAPAEALGAELIFYNDDEMQFPQVKKLLFQSTKEIVENRGLENREAVSRGRIGLICEAIGLLKKDIGDRVVISGIIPGPYTLLIYICKAQNLFREMKSEPQTVLDALLHLSSFLAEIGIAYRDAGADFITVHDMGGSPGFIGPGRYEQFAFPAEKRLIELLPKPRVLSVCGNATKSLHLLNEVGAEAVSLDQTVNLKEARLALKDTLLFGNLDPVATLWRGDEESITEAVTGAREAGADAVWPGCDLVPQTPIQNMAAMRKG